MKLKNLEVLIKPASSKCNLSCSYCFYKDEAKNRLTADRGFMSPSCAEKLIKSACELAEEEISFIFQGGEPLLASLEFFRDFVKRAEELNSGKRKLSFALQTNGSLISDDSAAFFKEKNFLLGVSLDGPEKLHDKFRGEGSFRAAMRGISLLKKHSVPFNILCVLTEENAADAARLYGFFREQGLNNQQYIPCLEPLEAKEGSPFLSAETLGKFLCDLYFLYINDLRAGENISIRYFESLAAVLMGTAPGDCTLCPSCSLQLTVEGDGAVYPCDFYCLDEYCLGNINETDFSALLKGEKARGFIAPPKPPEECRACSFYRLCAGGCRREYNKTGRTKFCLSHKMLFEKMRSEARLCSEL